MLDEEGSDRVGHGVGDLIERVVGLDADNPAGRLARPHTLEVAVHGIDRPGEKRIQVAPELDDPPVSIACDIVEVIG
jgi:hypothetical protein